MSCLIVQSDKTVLLEVAHPDAAEARLAIAPFAELERAPEHVHTYRLTPLGLWNARAAGHSAAEVTDTLTKFSRFPVPHSLLVDITETMARYGKLAIVADDKHGLVLESSDTAILMEVVRNKKINPLLGEQLSKDSVVIRNHARGLLKQALLKVGWPADDTAGYVEGSKLEVKLSSEEWELREYQRLAVDAFWAGGSGVVVLPCGAGKTVVGMAAMAQAQATTLILVTNTVSARQWRREILARTSLKDEEIGEYTGERKDICPVTIATYQIMTSRSKVGSFRHLGVFSANDWGLIIYDEVHLLPAPVFRYTADLQSRRRLGLTATLVREDGREGDVFSLIGPKRFDAPWRDMESQGWIAPAVCTEIRVSFTPSEHQEYAMSEQKEQYRYCATIPAKTSVVQDLLKHHEKEQCLVIGVYLQQLEELSKVLNAPLITGGTPSSVREELYESFRTGIISTLIVSKVANFSVDLPEATVAIQVSGTFGSRQEEAQRLGRVLRPKKDGRNAFFYTIVTRDSLDADYAAHRQRFLAEQGYEYTIRDAADVY